MTFIPKGTHAAFAGKEQKFEKKISMYDKLVRIVEYDIEKSRIIAKDENGADIIIQISRDAIARNKKFESMASVKFFGHLINEGMSKHLKVGDLIVAERSCFFKRERIGDKSFMVFESTRILSCPDQGPEKVHRGLFTVSKYGERVAAVQEWSPKATDNTAAVIMKLQEQEAAVARGERVVPLGFMLRAIKANSEGGFTCVNSSPPIDWIFAVKDEEGNEITKGSTLTAAYFLDTVGAYKEYLDGEGIAHDMVDIMTYRNIKSSTQSKWMDLAKDFGIKRMVERKVKLSEDDEEGFAGRVWAVSGIIQITGDEAKKEGKNLVLVPRNLATRLHANGPMGDVRNWVRTEGNLKVKTLDSLKFATAFVEMTTGEVVKPAVQAHPVTESVQEVAGPVSSDGFLEFDDDSDPFGD